MFFTTPLNCSQLTTENNCLQIDASEIGASVVLFQRGNRPAERLIIAYAGKNAEKRYAAVEWKCLAKISETDKFRVYLKPCMFKLFRDNVAITWLNRAKNTNLKLIRWSLQLANLEFVVKHVPGVQNKELDMLSHHPVSGPTFDKDWFEELLEGAPTTGSGNANNAAVDNLFAITECIDGHSILRHYNLILAIR